MTASNKIARVKCENCNKIVFRRVRSDSRLRFCSSVCSLPKAVEKSKTVDRRREKNPAWRGGTRMSLGYKFILKPEHPRANNEGYIQEHHLIMEESIGRYLTRDERVHHKNGIKTDNRIENLLLLESQSEHLKHHIKEGSINLRYWKGKKRSRETRLKMSISQKQRWEILRSHA